MSENEEFKQEEKTIFLGGFVIVVILLVIFIINDFPGYLHLIVGLMGVALIALYFRSLSKEKRFSWIKEYIYAKERTRKKEELENRPEEDQENPESL